MLNSQGKSMANCDTNTYAPQDLEISSISYRYHQLAEPNS